MTFNNAVEKLVENGQFNYGQFKEAIKILNPLDAEFFKSFTPDLFKQSRLKEWQVFNLSSNAFSGLLLIMDLKYVQVLHVNVYDQQKRRLYKKTIMKPPLTFNLLNGLNEGHFFYSDETVFLEIFTSNDLKPLRINLSFISEMDQIPVKMLIEAKGVETEPYVYCKPIQSEKAVYAHRKLVPSQGSIMISTAVYPLDDTDAKVIAEDYKSFQPYEMDSAWVAATLKAESDVAIYLSVNPYSTDSEICENSIWIDGISMPLSNVTLNMGPLGWQFTSEDASVNLTFVPKTLNRLEESFMLVKGSCDLPCGVLSGQITVDGDTIHLNEVPAVGGRLELKL